MSYDNQAAIRFIELMGELFQLDEAEALDFGLYRIIRRHNREVHESAETYRELILEIIFSL